MTVTDPRTSNGHDRRRDGLDVVGDVGPPPVVGATTTGKVLPHTIRLPIDADDVRAIATEGYPLWEQTDVMVLRNQRITVGYADLSLRLAAVLAGLDPSLDGDQIRASSALLDANWCTYATWSSKTIGAFIEDIPEPDGDAVAALGQAGPVPGVDGVLGHPRLDQLLRRAVACSNGACFRTLAAGNRVVFLEIGLAIARFVDDFPHRAVALGRRGERSWELYWRSVESQLAELAMLDPSWLLTRSPPPDELRLGLYQYFEALRAPDQERRSQHVLAGNLLLGAYEQRRVDGYVWAALALFPEQAMQRLVQDHSGAGSGVRRWADRLFARAMTRRITLHLPRGEVVWIGQPIGAPPDPRDRWHRLTTDADVTLPVLQALITRYQLAVGRRPNCGARNWTSFDQRMRTIGNLFRMRQRQTTLFDAPFTPAETARLLDGEGGSDCT